VFYAIPSERLLVERIDFDLSFSGSVGLGIDDSVWDASTFSKDRDRLLHGDVAVALLAAILDRSQVKRLLSTEHFSVDGTLIETWASMESFRPKEDGDGQDPPSSGGSAGESKGGRNGEVDLHAEKRWDATHASTTAPLRCRHSPRTVPDHPTIARRHTAPHPSCRSVTIPPAQIRKKIPRNLFAT
jgi:hypothetical protein